MGLMSLLFKIKASPYLQVFAVYLRYLIGGAFIISTFTLNKWGLNDYFFQSMEKQPIHELDPIAQFFRVMVGSGMYWHFIGVSQLMSGLLLMTQKFARLGALLFFIIMLNIFIITISFGFHGTPVVTGLMLLAGLFLIIWDLPAFIPLIADSFQYEKQVLQIADQQYWIKLGVVMIVTIVLLGLYYPNLYLMLGLPFLEGLIAFLLFLFLKKWPNQSTD